MSNFLLCSFGIKAGAVKAVVEEASKAHTAYCEPIQKEMNLKKIL